MVLRVRAPLALLLLLAALGPGAAGAQVSAPRLVEEDEEVVDDPAPAPAPAPPEPAASPSAPAPDAPPAPPPAAATPAPPPPAPGPDLARPIAPVRATYPDLLARWWARRAALREADPARADAERQALLAAKADLGIDNLVPLAAAEVREVARALASNLPAEALAHADTAVALAPDHADGHVARARSLLAASPPALGAALGAVRDAVAAAAREPHTRRAFLGDLLSAALAALFTAATATILLLLARSLPLFLHDFHHLPLLRGTAAVQTGFLALVLLGTPVVFGLGPLATLAVAAVAAWLYLSTRERLVVTAALLAVAALPGLAGSAARATAWTGTAAETVHELEHGALSDAQAAAVHAAAASSATPAPILAALGRHAKRRGDLAGALRLYDEAAAADPRAAEVLVNRGNVLFLQGDLEGAKAAYLAAQDQAGDDLVVLGAAHYNLSRLYLRTSEMDRSAAARDRAEREAGEFLRARTSEADFTANRYLADVPVPPGRIAALAAADGAADAIRGWVEARLLGPLPRATLPFGAAGLLGALWILGLAAGRLAPARACTTCGRPACARCDGAAGPTCGQCVNVFQKRNVVDARDRLRKEAQVRRHARFVRAATRVLSVVGGGAGQVVHGAAARGALLLLATFFTIFVVWFWRGLLPPPQPSPYVLAGKVALAVPVGLGLWAFAIRDAFRRTR